MYAAPFLKYITMQSLTSQVTQKDVTKKPTTKEPDYYIYRLIKQNTKHTINTPPFPPYFSIPNTSIIAYNPDKDEYNEKEGRKKSGALKICYLHGVETIFSSEQKDIPKETFRNQENKPVFIHGEIKVPSYNKTLKNFLDWTCLNADSPFRRDDAPVLFKRVDEHKDQQKEIELMKLRKKAFDVAFNCSDEDMLPHAEFLNIKFNSPDGTERDIELIRLDYQKWAESNPKKFIESVNNPKMRTFAMVKKAIAASKIQFSNGNAVWGESKKIICTVPMDKDRVEFLVDFSYTDDGASFIAALKASV